MACSATDTLRTQQISLDPLAWVIIDNRVALDYLFLAQGGVCAIANASRYTWLNTFLQVELEMTKLLKFEKSLKRHSIFLMSTTN